MYRTFDSLHHAYELLNRRIRTLLTHFGQKLNHFCFNWDSWQIKLILSLKIEAFSKFDLSIFIESSNDVLFIRQFFGFWFKFFFIILDPSSNFPHQTIEFIFEVIFGPPFHFQANSDPFGSIIKVFFQKSDWLFFAPFHNFREIVIKSDIVNVSISILFSSFREFFFGLIQNASNFFPTFYSSLFSQFSQHLFLLRWTDGYLWSPGGFRCHCTFCSSNLYQYWAQLFKARSSVTRHKSMQKNAILGNKQVWILGDVI